MRIAAIAFGTRGDVQPALALGRALQARGHQVQVVVSADFADDVRAAGLDVEAAAMDTSRALTTRRGHDVIESGNGAGMLTLVRTMKRLFSLNGPMMMESTYRACANADAVISSYTSDVYTVSVAQKLGIRHISTVLQPAPVATRSGAATPSAPLGAGDSMVNLAFHKTLIEPFAWRLMSGPTNEFRREVLGMPEQSRRDYQRTLLRSPILQGFSPNVVPHPKDWPANIHTTGYWLLDHDLNWAPPRDLLDFLDDGEPPVYIGFGAMTARDPAVLTQIVVDAVKATGRRAVIQSGWARLGESIEGKLPRGIHVIDQASHRWLFHRVSAVVHHGGAGTTATGLRVGLPTVVVPHMGDQPFWGRRVAALGAGPKPISSAKLTVKNLAEAIEQATGDPVMRQRAADLGSRLRAEDGVGTAVTLIEKYLAED
jgi:UDP:flavonoid glycosyltransferase YjiC (YdhE family)